MNDIKHIAYEKYKLDWMINQGYTIQDIIELVFHYFNDTESNVYLYADCERYIEEVGFGGGLWVCFDEFLDYEYQDEEYMGWLLNSYEFYEYKKDIGEEN